MKKELSNPIRWGIIGCGAVTEIKSGPAYRKTQGFHLAAVMRRDYDKARDFAARHGIDVFFIRAEDIIDNNDIDAVYIATPPDSHKQYALKVAAAGKICCVEKPLAPGYADSLAIHQAFEEKGLPLFVAYYRRSLPRFNEVKKLLESGDIGEIRHVSWQLTRPPNQFDLGRKKNWRTENHIAPGGYFDDLACHGLDLFAYLLGDYAEVKGIALNQQGLYSAKDAVTACWIHQSGATGSGSWNFACNTRKDEVEILGNKGQIRFSIFEDQPLVLSNDEGEREIHIENPENIQLHHVQNMADQLFRGVPHPSNGQTALHTSWVMDRILGRTK